MNSKDENKYLGFYTTPPFWAINPVDLEKINLFEKSMSEVTAEYKESGYHLMIYRDGLIQFSIKSIEENISNDKSSSNPLKIEKSTDYWSRYLTYANAIYLILESVNLTKKRHAAFEIQEVTRAEAFRISENVQSLPVNHLGQVYFMDRFLSQYPSNYPVKYSTRLRIRSVIDKEVLDDTNTTFSEIFDNYETISVLSGLTKSLGEYKMGNYSTSLVLAWFIIERFVNRKFENYLLNKGIVGKRKESLGDERTYTTAVKLNILEISSELNNELFQKIENARKKRNDIVHETYKTNFQLCSAVDCQNAFDVIGVVLRLEYGISLDFNTGYSLTGL